MKKITAAVISLILALIFVAGCGKDPDTTPETLDLRDENGTGLYTVVFPSSATEYEKKAARVIASAVSAKTVSDGEEPSGRCIFVGKTSSEASGTLYNTLSDGQYSIRNDGENILIAGTDDVNILYAAEKFVSLLLPVGNSGLTFAVKDCVGGVYTVDDGPVEGKFLFSKAMGRYKTQGRTTADDKGVSLYGAADGIEFNADCSGSVTVTVSVSDELNCGEYSGLYLAAYIDGERVEKRFHVNTHGSAEIVIAEGLEQGKHSFGIYRQTEQGNDGLRVVGVSFDGTFAETPAPGDYMIEFVGDSLTSGFGIMDSLEYDGAWQGDAIYCDATLAYGFLTAKNLNADYSIVAVQGMGVYCGPQSRTMNEIYNCYPFNDKADYVYPNTRPADVVVVQMLANDMETKEQFGATDEQIFEAFKNLLLKIRERNPNAKIIVVSYKLCTDQQRAVVNELGGKDAGFYYHDIPSDGNGHGGHPSVDAHKATTKNLTMYIQKLLGIYERKKAD